jgi:uncharacterized protein YmfQ (DUF2313 family)
MSDCPDLEQTLASLEALKPRGRAWQNSPFVTTENTVQRQTFRALAEPFRAANARLCALVAEFFCKSAVETLEIWNADHGLPDPCDPFPDLCSKVNGVGDTTPAYAIAAALRLGWVIAIEEQFITAGRSSSCGNALAGASLCAAQQGVTWLVTIDTEASPSFEAQTGSVPLAGRFLAGRSLSCLPDISALECILRRIMPAHVDLVITQE